VSYPLAAALYRQAAEQGHDKAQYQLAWLHFHGQGVIQDHKMALQWLMKSAEQGNAEAMSMLQKAE